MIDPAQLLAHPVASLALRGLLGGYVIYMARKFYADPTGYFRKVARPMVDLPWLAPMIRAMACFCLWGGCFIVATAVSVQIFGLHGDLLALALIAVAAVAAWFLLPSQEGAEAEEDSGVKD
jgi:hypothetical protein